MKKTIYAIVIASVALLSCKKEEKEVTKPKDYIEVRISTLRNCNDLEIQEIIPGKINDINLTILQENFGKDCINYVSVILERNKQFILNVDDEMGFYAGHHLNTNTTQAYLEVTLK